MVLVLVLALVLLLVCQTVASAVCCDRSSVVVCCAGAFASLLCNHQDVQNYWFDVKGGVPPMLHDGSVTPC